MSTVASGKRAFVVRTRCSIQQPARSRSEARIGAHDARENRIRETNQFERRAIGEMTVGLLEFGDEGAALVAEFDNGCSASVALA